MHTEWLKSKENKMHTGILCFDLSAAFDLLSPDLFCEKFGAMGANEHATKWFHSFLTGRSQRVKIGDKLSEPKYTTIGSPQGSLLSPLLFTLFLSDLEDWLEGCKTLSYADDTSSVLQVRKE